MRDKYFISLIGSTKLAIRNQLMDHSSVVLRMSSDNKTINSKT